MNNHFSMETQLKLGKMTMKIRFISIFRAEVFLKIVRSPLILLEYSTMNFTILNQWLNLNESLHRLKIGKELPKEIKIIKKICFRLLKAKKEQRKIQIKSYFKDLKIQNAEERNGVSELIFLTLTFSLIKPVEVKQKLSLMKQKFYFSMKMNMFLLKIQYFEIQN